MNHAVPGVASVVDDDVDFTVAEICGLLDERLKILVVEHVARGGNGFPATLVDSIGNILCLFYFAITISREFLKDFPIKSISSMRDSHRCHVQKEPSKILTSINIAHNHLRPLIRKQPRRLSANALPRASDNRHLPVQHSLGVVEVSSDLLRACVGHVAG